MRQEASRLLSFVFRSSVETLKFLMPSPDLCLNRQLAPARKASSLDSYNQQNVQRLNHPSPINPPRGSL